MGMGVGELVVLLAMGAVLALGLLVGFWILRKTLSLVRRLVVLGLMLALFFAVGAAVIGAYVVYTLQ